MGRKLLCGHGADSSAVWETKRIPVYADSLCGYYGVDTPDVSGGVPLHRLFRDGRADNYRDVPVPEAQGIVHAGRLHRADIDEHRRNSGLPGIDFHCVV